MWLHSVFYSFVGFHPHRAPNQTFSLSSHLLRTLLTLRTFAYMQRRKTKYVECVAVCVFTSLQFCNTVFLSRIKALSAIIRFPTAYLRYVNHSLMTSVTFPPAIHQRSASPTHASIAASVSHWSQTSLWVSAEPNKTELMLVEVRMWRRVT